MKSHLLSVSLLELAVGTTAVDLAQVTMPRSADEPVAADSALVVQVRDALAGAPALVCELIADPSRFSRRNPMSAGLGRVSDASPSAEVSGHRLMLRISDPAAQRQLAAGLSHVNPCVREWSARQLGRSTAPDAVIRQALQSSEARLREAGALAAGAGRDARDALLPELQDLLQDETAGAAMAAWAIGMIDPDRSIELLARAISSDSRDLRLAATWALAESDDQAAIEPLLGSLRDPDAAIRGTAAKGLGDLEALEAVDVLEGLAIHDGAREVRLAAVEALGDIELRRSADVLTRLALSSDVELATRALYALSDLDDLDTAPSSVLDLASSPELDIGRAATVALAEIGDPRALPVFLRLLDSSDRKTRLAAIEGLEELEQPEAAPALKRILQDPDPKVRAAAARALGSLDGR